MAELEPRLHLEPAPSLLRVRARQREICQGTEGAESNRIVSGKNR